MVRIRRAPARLRPILRRLARPSITKSKRFSDLENRNAPFNEINRRLPTGVALLSLTEEEQEEDLMQDVDVTEDFFATEEEDKLEEDTL